MDENKLSNIDLQRKDFKAFPGASIVLIDDFYSDKSSNFYDIHYDYEVGIVMEGVVTRKYRDFEKTLYPGDVWVAGIWEPHGFELEEVPSEMVCFILSPECLGKVLPIGFNWIKIFSQDGSRTPLIKPEYKPLILGACNELKKVISNGTNAELAWKSNILTRILLYVIESNAEEYSKLHMHTEDIIENDEIKEVVNLVFQTNGAVTVNEAASRCMISASHFSRLFKKVTGVTFAKFALGHRIKQSAISLIDTSEPVKKIASDWGFTDSSHYIKTFEKFFGVSPSEFRKKSLEAKDSGGITTTDSLDEI